MHFEPAVRMLATIGLIASGCGGFERGALSGALPGTPGGPSIAPDFATTIYPLLEARCADCHGPASGRPFVLLGDLDPDYENALGFVDLDNPSGSALVLKGTGVGHGGGATLRPDDPEVRLLVTWIAAGAPFAATEPVEAQ